MSGIKIKSPVTSVQRYTVPVLSIHFSTLTHYKIRRKSIHRKPTFSMRTDGRTVMT